MPPFEYRRAWHVARPLDLKVMKSAAKHFVGTRHFAAFAANRGKPERTTIRTINSARVRKKGPCITIEFDGDGFLYKMVRLMVGALVQCALGKIRIDEITSRLRSGKIGSARFTAPAEGFTSFEYATNAMIQLTGLVACDSLIIFSNRCRSRLARLPAPFQA